MIKRKRNYNAGFTYVELIVVLGLLIALGRQMMAKLKSEAGGVLWCWSG